jgi:hypothetical protein
VPRALPDAAATRAAPASPDQATGVQRRRPFSPPIRRLGVLSEQIRRHQELPRVESHVLHRSPSPEVHQSSAATLRSTGHRSSPPAAIFRPSPSVGKPLHGILSSSSPFSPPQPSSRAAGALQPHRPALPVRLLCPPEQEEEEGIFRIGPCKIL